MTGKILGVIDSGTRGSLVDIECHVSKSLPAIVIVGSASKAVDEAKERLRGAFANAGLEMPRKRITINLAPADIPKTDSSFDVPIALAILQASGQIARDGLRDTACIGELGLDGSIRSVRGIIGKLLAGRHHGIHRFVIPTANVEQAQLVPHIELIPAGSIKDLYNYLTTGVGIQPQATHEGIIAKQEALLAHDGPLISEIVGQTHAKRGLEIAAAGGHNIFFSGPPGTGKSMLAKALPSLLPLLNHEEVLEVTHLHSLASNDYDKLLLHRPFRAPHHSASHVAIVGGGHSMRPGEISLSHRGVLFFDEMPEFSRSTLEALRQPMEDRTVSVARAKETIEYPANFILVATANPCPCGFYGTSKPCTCLPHQISRYQQRISGPILDRIDLHSVVQEIEHKNLLRQPADPAIDQQIRQRIRAARQRQADRYGSASKLNCDMTNQDIKKLGQLAEDAKEMLDVAAERLNISARSYMKTVKVARTIADLSGSGPITTIHIGEALQYRRQEQPIA